MKGSSLEYTLALATNIRLGWKGLPVTNTLAYYECKKFYKIGTRLMRQVPNKEFILWRVWIRGPTLSAIRRLRPRSRSARPSLTCSQRIKTLFS